MTPAAMLAKFAKAHGGRVEEVMSATGETPLAEIAAILERKPIKRVPIVRDGQSRAVLEPRH
jgi:CBS domain-containing protein